jgi:ribose-phosphate pyrophosphokinase
MILGGSTSKSLAQDLAQVLGLEYVQALTKRFPDGEAYVRIERDALDKEVVLVQNTYPDANLVELLLLLDAARGLGADKITCVIPYFGYARQDRRFNPGEALSAKVMLRHLEMEMDRLLTIDLHKPDVLEWFAQAPAKDLKATRAIGDYFGRQGIDLVLGPDKGAAQRAAEVAKIIGCESDHLGPKARRCSSWTTSSPQAALLLPLPANSSDLARARCTPLALTACSQEARWNGSRACATWSSRPTPWRARSPRSRWPRWSPRRFKLEPLTSRG